MFLLMVLKFPEGRCWEHFLSATVTEQRRTTGSDSGSHPVMRRGRKQGLEDSGASAGSSHQHCRDWNSLHRSNKHVNSLQVIREQNNHETKFENREKKGTGLPRLSSLKPNIAYLALWCHLVGSFYYFWVTDMILKLKYDHIQICLSFYS